MIGECCLKNNSQVINMRETIIKIYVKEQRPQPGVTTITCLSTMLCVICDLLKKS